MLQIDIKQLEINNNIMNKKILITTSSYNLERSVELRGLEKKGWQIICNPFKRKLRQEETAELFANIKPVGIIAGVERIGVTELEYSNSIQVISRCGVGLDSVDLKECEYRKILVYTTPNAPTDAVAELALGIAINCLRGISDSSREMKNGKWRSIRGGLLRDRVFGIVGYGRIGRRLSELLVPFKTKTVFYDPTVNVGTNSALGLAVDLNYIFKQSQIISLHVPYTPENHHMISTEQLRMMRRDAIIVNTSRGGLIDEKALASALKTNAIHSAGLDVFESEPYNGELCEIGNAVLTSHMSSNTEESRNLMEDEAVSNLISGLTLKRLV